MLYRDRVCIEERVVFTRLALQPRHRPVVRRQRVSSDTEAGTGEGEAMGGGVVGYSRRGVCGAAGHSLLQICESAAYEIIDM